MGKTHRTKSTEIILTMLLLCQIVACGVKQPDNETVYEEIIACSYHSYDGNIDYEQHNRHRFLITLLSHNVSDYRNVCCLLSAREYGYNDIADTVYLEKIKRNEPYFPKFGIELKKDTLGAFYYYGMTKIELDAEAGRKFCDYPPEEQLETDWGIILKSKIFDTVFNDILHVKQCFCYTYEDDSWRIAYMTDSMVRCYLYYDVDRCMFVHAEARNLDTDKLIYIHRVERVNRIDSMYFNKMWNSMIRQDTILEPMLAPTNYL